LQRSTITWIFALILAATVSIAGTLFYVGGNLRRKLIISTTTSLFDTGLLDIIEDKFEEEYSIDLYFISVGTGLAITHAERGDADLILVHAPSKEKTFLEGGYGTCRKIVAYNFFAVVGPETDPANVTGLQPKRALLRIVENCRHQRAKWVSRGDDSGTHTKERELWTVAGFNWTSIRDEPWYVEAGAGMGKTLQVADNLDAYTVADMGTFLKYKKDGIIGLHALVAQGEELLNVYSAIAGNPTKHPHINYEDAIAFIKYLVSEEGQHAQSSFANEYYGQSLFYPAVNILEQNDDSTELQWMKKYAFIDGYECPPEFWNNHPELYT
jgi:tungstate transport system substrate-binding protein